MNLTELTAKIATIRKGAYVPIVYKTTIASNKDYKNIVVTKITRAIVRLGCSYDHLKTVQMARAATQALGVEKPNTSRTYEWIKDENGETLFPYLYKGSKGINLRLTIAHNVRYKQFEVIGYYANGVEITKVQAQMYTRPSAWTERTTPFDVFDKNIEDIISLGH